MAAPGVINMTAAFQKQTRELKSGTQVRNTVEFSADSVVVDVSDEAMREHMKMVASAIGEAIIAEINGISRQAKPSTIERRQRALNDRKSSWYRKNYSGGRIGERPPSAGTQLFNDSGRLKKLVVNFRRTSRGVRSATLNFPANRFNPEMLPGGKDAQMFAKLQEVVPTLRGEFTGQAAVTLGNALDAAIERMVLVGDATAQLLILQAQIKANAAELQSLTSGIVQVVG